MLFPWMSRIARRKDLPRLCCSLSTSPSPRPGPSAQRQRSYSSSKPSSSSSDKSRPISAPTDAPTKEAAPTVRKRASTKLGRPKSKDGLGKASTNPIFALPSVPSTQHLNRQDVHIASFFSLYRPISVVSPVPPTSTTAAFSSIFKTRPPSKSKQEDVIYALSSVVQTLDKAANQAEHRIQSEADLRVEVTQASQSQIEPNADSQSIFVSIEELSKNYCPFNPPPPPLPMEETPKTRRKSRADTAPVSKEVPTGALLETLFEDPLPAHRQPFLERMRIRQERFNVIQERRRISWHAISVRRQRKLKMKKHKYKKLMRRTRNLRRRQDRL